MLQKAVDVHTRPAKEQVGQLSGKDWGACEALPLPEELLLGGGVQ